MNREGGSFETGLSGEADEASLANEFSEVIGEVFVFKHSTPKFGESGVLDLADPLAGDVELVADFLQSFLLRVIVESKAKSENFKFPLGQDFHATGDSISKISLRVLFGRVDGTWIGQKIDKAAVVSIRSESHIEGDSACGNFAQFRDAVGFDLQFVRQLGIGGFATEFGSEGGADSAKALDFIDEMNGKADSFALVGESPTDGLFDPPAGVGAEFDSPTGFEAVDRFHESKVALRYEVKDRQAAVVVSAGNLYDEAKVRLDHELASLGFSAANPAGDLFFVLLIQEGSLPDSLEVGLKSSG
jgi:hypothetical protein